MWKEIWHCDNLQVIRIIEIESTRLHFLSIKYFISANLLDDDDDDNDGLLDHEDMDDDGDGVLDGEDEDHPDYNDEL